MIRNAGKTMWIKFLLCQKNGDGKEGLENNWMLKKIKIGIKTRKQIHKERRKKEIKYKKER